MNPSTRFADGDSNFEVLWEDDDYVFCRGWRLGADGNRSAVLAVLPAAEHPAPAARNGSGSRGLTLRERAHPSNGNRASTEA
jgi:hypothetical protein